MIGGHLGNRVSDLLDGQLERDEEDRAWQHVHACHYCRDLVEREGWIKTSLAGLSFGSTATPDSLKGSLLGALPASPCGGAYLTEDREHRRRQIGLVALGGGAVGAAVMGVLALGVAPADAPVNDRRAPASITHTQSPRTVLPTEPTVARSSAVARRH